MQEKLIPQQITFCSLGKFSPNALPFEKYS